VPPKSQITADPNAVNEMLRIAQQEFNERFTVPTVDQESVITGTRNILTDPKPEDQPGAARLQANIEFLESRHPEFKAQLGTRIRDFDPEFNPVDQFQSGGFSFGDVAKRAFSQSITGDIEVALERGLGFGNQEANLFGLIDQNRLEAFQPNLAEEIGSGVLSFFMPIDVALLAVGGGGVKLGRLAFEGLGVKSARGLANLGLKSAEFKAVQGASLSAAQRIVPRSITGATTLGTYEGVRGFFEGINSGEDPFESIYRGLGSGAKGAIIGAGIGIAAGSIPTLIGPSKLSEGMRKQLANTSRISSEIFTLGTISPFLEGEAPSKESFINAAGFIVGMKSIGALGRLPSRARFEIEKNKVVGELTKEFEFGRDLNEQFYERVQAVIDKGFYRKEVVESLINGEEGFEIQFKDLLPNNQSGREVRRIFGDLGDTRIKISNKVPEGFLKDPTQAAGWVGIDPVDAIYKVFLNPEATLRTGEGKAQSEKSAKGQFGVTILHEMGHLLRLSRGGEITGEAVKPFRGRPRTVTQIGDIKTEELTGLLTGVAAPSSARRVRQASLEARIRARRRLATGLEAARKRAAVRKEEGKARPLSETQKVKGAQESRQRAFEAKLKDKGVVKVRTPKGEVPESLGSKTRRMVNRLLPTGKTKATSIRIISQEASRTPPKGPAGDLYGPKRKGAVIAEFKPEVKKGKKTQLILDISAPTVREIRELLQQVVADAKGTPVFIGPALIKTKPFQGMIRDGIISPEKVGKFHKVVSAEIPKGPLAKPSGGVKRVGKGIAGTGPLTEKGNKRLAGFFKRALRNEEARGIVDELAETNISVESITKEFFRDGGTYDALNDVGRARIDKFIVDMSGFKPGDVVTTKGGKPADVAKSFKDIGRNFLDLPSEAEFLEGLDVGFVATMVVGTRALKSIPVEPPKPKILIPPIDQPLRDTKIDALAKQNKDIGEPPGFRLLPRLTIKEVRRVAKNVTWPLFLKQQKNRGSLPEYKQIVRMILDAAEQTALVRGANYSQVLGPVLKPITPGIIEEGKSLVTGRDKFQPQGEQITRDLLKGAQTPQTVVIRKVMDDLRDLAGKVREKPIGFIKNYVPNSLRRDIRDKSVAELGEMERDALTAEREGRDVERAVLRSLISRTKGTKDILEFVQVSGKFKTKRQALAFAQKYLVEEMVAEPSYLKRRKLPDWPEHLREMDVRVWLPEYIAKMSEFIGQTQVFGINGKKAQAIIKKLEEKSYEEAQEAHRAIAMFTGAHELEYGLRGRLKTAADWYTGFQVITKIAMGGATLLNLSQPFISIIPALGTYRTLKGAFSLFDPEVRKRIGRTGVVDNMNIKSMEAIAGHRPGGRMGKFVDFATTLSGFQGVNKGLLFLSAATMDVAIKDFHRLANEGGVRSNFANKKLQEFNIDKNKDLDSQEQKILKAMFRFATDSQLQRNFLNEPIILNNPIFRPLFLFKRFGLRQATFIKDLIIQDAKKGNYTPILRLAGGGYIGGTGVVWALNTIKTLLSGEEVLDTDDTTFQEVVNRISRVGALGYMSDFMDIQDLRGVPRAVRFALYPVAVSDIETVMDAFQKFANDWNRTDDLSLSLRRNIFGLTGVLGSFGRATGRRFQTGPQKAARISFKKGRQRSEIFELMLVGNHRAATARRIDWDKKNPNDKFKMAEILYPKEIEAHMRRKARSFAAASEKKDTPEFRRAERKRFGELQTQLREQR